MDIKEYLIENYGIYDITLKQMSKDTGYTEGSIKTIASGLGLKMNTKFEEYECEEWKSLSLLGFSNYSISNYSRVKNKDGRLLKSSPHHQSGYHQIRIINDEGNRASVICHKIMYITFNGFYDESAFECDHIDGNRDNNELVNIQLITPSENVRKQKKRISGVTYLTTEEIIDICEKLELKMSISKIANTNEKYTKSRVEKIKQRIRWVSISKNYNF